MVNFLNRPIDAAILIYFRIVAGILMAQELINLLMIGKFAEYVEPQFHFSYLYFDWLKPWPYWGMVVHFSLTIFSAFAVAFNFHYRIFSVLLFLGYSSLFLMEQTEYINHTYLYCLISFWMMVLPLNKTQNSRPAWMLYIFIFHMALAYFFAGIAKLNTDWLMGSPMNLYLGQTPLRELKWAPYAFSYGGLFFDLLMVPMMVFKPTRFIGLFLSILFHLSNVLMFGLATFPWFSLLLTSMFFDPSWPRRIPIFRRFMPWGIERAQEFKTPKILVGALVTYALIHVSLPLRHHLYPGNPSWTEEAHMFSWRMMLRQKNAHTRIQVINRKNHQITFVNPSDYLTKRQIGDMNGNPDMLLQFSHYLKKKFEKEFNSKVSIYISSQVGLNGRKKTELIRPGTDLALEERTIKPYAWIMPLDSNPIKKARISAGPIIQNQRDVN